MSDSPCLPAYPMLPSYSYIFSEVGTRYGRSPDVPCTVGLHALFVI